MNNESYRIRYSVSIYYQQRYHRDDVENSHTRNNLFCCLSDRLEAAENDDRYQNSKHGISDNWLYAKGYLNGRHNRISLSIGTGTETCGHDTENGE